MDEHDLVPLPLCNYFKATFSHSVSILVYVETEYDGLL